VLRENVCTGSFFEIEILGMGKSDSLGKNNILIGQIFTWLVKPVCRNLISYSSIAGINQWLRHYDFY
jgi:hypothetical protein